MVSTHIAWLFVFVFVFCEIFFVVSGTEFFFRRLNPKSLLESPLEDSFVYSCAWVSFDIDKNESLDCSITHCFRVTSNIPDVVCSGRQVCVTEQVSLRSGIWRKQVPVPDGITNPLFTIC